MLTQRFERCEEGFASQCTPVKSPSSLQVKIMDPKYARDIHHDIPMQARDNINQSQRTFFNRPHKTRDPIKISLLFFKSQWCQISQWDTMKGVSSLYSFWETQTLSYFFIQRLRLKHHQWWRLNILFSHGSIQLRGANYLIHISKNTTWFTPFLFWPF